MSLEQAILEAVRALPTGKQQEVLHHATCLRQQTADKRPLRSVKSARNVEKLPAGRYLMAAVVVDTHSSVPAFAFPCLNQHSDLVVWHPGHCSTP
jgi:hypothetical protein